MGESAAAGSAVTSVVTQMTSSLADFSVENIVATIAGGLAIAVPLVLAWFAFRFIYRKAKGGLKRGA